MLPHWLVINPNLRGIFRGWGWGWVLKLPPPHPRCLKLVRITLETSTLARMYTPIFSFRKYTFYCLGTLNFADVSIFFCKKSTFFVQKSTFTQSNIVWELCQRFFSSDFSICKKKGFYYWKRNFCRLCVWNPASGMLQIGQKSKKWHDVKVKLFWRCFFSLVKFSYWSKFHISINNGVGIMAIFFDKGLTRNLEIGNTPVWVLHNIWRLGRVMDIKFGTNVSNRMLLNAAKFHDYSFYRFWVLRENQRGGRGWVKLPHPPRLGLMVVNVESADLAELIALYPWPCSKRMFRNSRTLVTESLWESMHYLLDVSISQYNICIMI